MTIKKLLFLTFSENASHGVAILCALAKRNEWQPEILFVPPKEDISSILKAISDYNPDLIAFSFTSFERNQAIRVARQIQPLKIKTIAGGVHPTVMPNDVSREAVFDAIICGDGMGIWCTILQDFKSLDGQIINGSRHNDLSAYADMFFSDSQIDRMKKTQIGSLITSYGCPYQCDFCRSGSDTFFNFPIENITNNIIKMYKDFDVRTFRVYDDIFAVSFDRVKKLRSILKEHSICISMGFMHARASCFTEDIANELVKLGVEGVHFGVETASARLLQFLNKRQTPEECKRAIQICKGVGLNVGIFLLFGIPTEKEEDYKATLDFVQEVEPDSVQMAYLCPYPGTSLFNWCFDNNYMPVGSHRDSFEWFNPSTGGNHELQLRLQNVDYRLASESREKIIQLVSSDDDVFDKIQVVDKKPWVFVGSTESNYFRTMFNRLSRRTWRNLLGYINIDLEAYFDVKEESKMLIHEYPRESTLKPHCFVTTYSRGGYFNNVLIPFLESQFGNDIRLISISSYSDSHKIEEIEKIVGRTEGICNLSEF